MKKGPAVVSDRTSDGHQNPQHRTFHMPKQPQRQAIVCCHAARCECNDCQVHMIEWFELLHDTDLLAARDPEPDARREFAEWVSQVEGGAA
jgi:hypothetical protein